MCFYQIELCLRSVLFNVRIKAYESDVKNWDILKVL